LGWTLHNDISVPYIVRYGNEDQKKKYLPACVSGELITAIAMTEPGTGSDLQGIKTTAVLEGDHYILNGSKTFITNGQKAGLVIVVAKTDTSAGSKGISLFLVEADLPGFSKGKNLQKLGLKAQDTSELFFQDVKVPKGNLLGEEGRGFIYLMQDLPQERLSIAVGAVANAQAIMEVTVNYTKERKAFGTTVASFQNTQFKLAELAAEVTSAEVFSDRCTELLLEGKLDTVTASKLKLLTTDLQCKVADECLQLHGGWGYMWEYPVCRAFADSRVQRIYGGSNEIMKLIISRDLMK
jgi:acyl-CoA dehydrogenase